MRFDPNKYFESGKKIKHHHFMEKLEESNDTIIYDKLY